MFKTRPCGCKGLRSCKLCEEQFGAWQVKITNDEDKVNGYNYCHLCNAFWPGWAVNAWEMHPNHIGDSFSISGIRLYPDFVSEEEESELLKNIDNVPWDLSQSGRYKQNYGPKCNFKKRKVKIGNFCGYPMFTQFVQEKFESINDLKGFQTVEQCSLEYCEDRGSSIDPHIDDCWIWGERIPTLSLLSDSVLTFNKFEGPSSKYNLIDSLRDVHNGDIDKESESSVKIDKLSINEVDDTKHGTSLFRVAMPRRSLLVLFGDARYDYEHSILREDIDKRRVCITYRELTKPFLINGEKESIGKEILEKAKLFFDT